jgi:hypothetical protein
VEKKKNVVRNDAEEKEEDVDEEDFEENVVEKENFELKNENF